MLLDRYEQYFFNANFREAADEAGWEAYRGELVLKEGEIVDDKGRRKPPHEVLKQVVVLAKGDELKLISGHLDALQHIPGFVEKYAADLKADTIAVLFAVNIDDPFLAKIGEGTVAFIPLVQGMAWNELIDLVALEKGDFKGQSAAEKVVTVFNGFKGHKFKYPETTLDDALKSTNNAKREMHGAV